jgi:hypothetical protein
MMRRYPDNPNLMHLMDMINNKDTKNFMEGE